ncbi:MAG: hypothetical protein KAJ51_05180 [Thermoplasmata archaeon]|nr:hypothetical protein [Thermoplasmata archaeon]
MTEADVGSMFHGLLFAYEKVLLNFFGKEETKKLFSYIIDELFPVLFNERNLVIDKSLGVEENMRRFECFLSNELLVKGLAIKKISEKQYVIDIEECVFAKGGIHDTLEMKGGSCPYALLVAAVLTSVEDPDQYINVGESEYTEEGSKTILNIE